LPQSAYRDVAAERPGWVYGDEVIQHLSTRLAATHGKGFSVRNLRNMRQFFLAFPGGSALAAIQQTPSAGSSPRIQQTLSARSREATSRSTSPAALAPQGATSPSQALVGGDAGAPFPQELSWSHYLVLTRVTKETARPFYEIARRRAVSTARPDECKRVPRDHDRHRDRRGRDIGDRNGLSGAVAAQRSGE